MPTSRPLSALQRLPAPLRAPVLWIGALALMAMLGTLALAGGVIGEFEKDLGTLRDRVRMHDASGDVQLVEIDAQSIRALESWPWPRAYHADVIRKLDAAGASTIAFDVDFSSFSNPGDDAALALAVKQSRATIVLPTFQQAAGSGSAARVEALPIPELQGNALLASVNAHPDGDGQLNNYSYGTITAGKVRPSLAAMVAGGGGALGGMFRIDQSIDPASIPRHSFADVIAGKDELDLDGKTVIVGATAIEIGDRYGTAAHGVLPGVVIQAMAAETLLHGNAAPSLGALPLLVATIAGFAVYQRIRWRRRMLRRAVLLAQVGLLLAAPLAVEALHIGSLEIMPAALFLLFAHVGLTAFGTIRALSKSRFTDRATGLPNLARLAEDWPAHASDAVHGALALARIDRFDQIASMLGEQARGELVVAIARRLALASSDGTIYRLGPDLLGWHVDASETADLPDRFDAAASMLHHAIDTSERQVSVKLHFGAALRNNNEVGTVAARAELAAVHAAETGERWRWHDDDLASDAENVMTILVELDDALANGDIWVAFQPKFDLTTGEVHGAEALVRWNHPERGMIRPDHFIPVLERQNRIDQLTLFVLERVIDRLEAWNRVGARFNCAVNISSKLLTNRAFVDAVVSRVAASPIAPEQLTLEVTESAAIFDPETTMATLESLKSLGTRISIDDYGTGQSTLSYLQKFPADELKIDQSFVKMMTSNRADRMMVESTIGLAHGLGFKVVAEGIEDEATQDMLREMGCDTLQGWHIGKPVAAEEFEARWVAGKDAGADDDADPGTAKAA